MECADFESRRYLAGHGAIERVELLGSVELDGTDTVDGVEEDVVRVVFGFLLWYLRTCGHLEVYQCRNGNSESKPRVWKLHTVAACPNIAGCKIFALRGMIEGGRHESLLSGLHDVVQEGRRNINGSKADIAVRQFRRSREGNILVADLFAILGANLGMFRDMKH